MQWHQLDHMQTTCTSLQADNHINTSSLNFYRLDALPDAEPTVSKAMEAQSTETKTCMCIFLGQLSESQVNRTLPLYQIVLKSNTVLHCK